MRALKTIVTVLGLVLAGGIGLLIYGLSQNWHRVAQSQPPAARPPLTSSIGWGRLALGSERVAAVSPAGDLLAVHLKGERGDRVIIVDPRSGAIIGTLTAGDAP